LKLKLGTNLGFAINRYIEPEIWAKIVARDLGLSSVQFVADLLNPFLPDEYISKMAGRIIASAGEYGIKIDSMFSSAYTRVNHLMHPDREAREIWLDWFCRFIDLGQKFGAVTLGSHFGILTFDAYETNREFLIEEGVKNWQKLSFYAKERGYEGLIFEPMSVPREMGHTIPEALELMDRVNANCGVPMRICLDVGHAPHPDYRNPYPWVEALGKYSPIIHIQQTVLNKSNHAPFTEEYNKTGIITGERLMDAIKKSGLEETILMFEIGHREHYDTEFRIIEDLKESVKYWRQWVKN